MYRTRSVSAASLFSFGLVLFCLTFLFPPAEAFARNTKIKIFVTTDVHGYVARDPQLGNIGFASLKGYIDEKKADGFTTFLLDCGDMFSGSAYAQIDQGKSMARLVALLGYNAMTIGNHEFDYNALTNDVLYFAGTLVPLVKKRAAKFAAVCINSLYRGAPLPNVQNTPVILYDETKNNPEGLRVIVAGIVNPEFAKKSQIKKLDGYDLGLRSNNKQTRKHVLAMLEKALKPYSRPNDVVLVLSHVGYSESRAKANAKKHLLNGMDLAGVPNVDFVLDGHTHNTVKPERVGDVWYVQGGRYLKRFTEITLKVGKSGGLSRDIELRSFGDTESVKPSAEVAKAIADIRRQHGFGNVLFDLTGPDSDFYSSDNIRWRSKPLGTLFAAAMHKSVGADFAVITANGFKGELYPRPLTVGHAHDVVPLAGNLMSAKIKGSRVYDLFSRFLVPGTGSFPQFHGITVKARQDEDNPRKPYRVLSITLANGQPLEPDREYTVAYNSRLFSVPKEEQKYMRGARSHGPVSSVTVQYFEKNRKLPWSSIAAEKSLRIQKGQ